MSLRTLVGIAGAIEREAVARYDQLAHAMRRRGESATAAAFGAMRDEESGHVAAVEQWAAVMGEVVPAQPFQWRLPEEISGAWDEAAGSALLTPYRAFAIAVDNEQRAFAYYAYLAAHADEARVQAAAEQLAAEELRHAALLRRWRRRAYHHERRAAPPPQPQAIETVEALRDLLARHEAAIAACHEALAGRLRRAGDEESARLLEGLNGPAAALAPVVTPTAAIAPTAAGQAPAPDASDPVHLLVAAQKPLEALSEALEAVLRGAQGRLMAEAEDAIASVMARLARVALQAEQRLRAPLR